MHLLYFNVEKDIVICSIYCGQKWRGDWRETLKLMCKTSLLNDVLEIICLDVFAAKFSEDFHLIES